MNIGNHTHRRIVIDILGSSFDDNQSINCIAKQDAKRHQRIRHLMGYCFDVCLKSGLIYISRDEKACALVLYPEFKKVSLRQNLSLIFKCIGIGNVAGVLKREKKLKAHHPAGLFYYLWFIGVYPQYQKQGIGSLLFKKILKQCDKNKRSIYLETSVERNIPWYKQYGFRVFNELYIDCKMYQMIRE